MTTRQASCSCGQLTVTCTGEPVRVSICHCLACQKRTGSVFGVQARYPRAAVVPSGRSAQYVRTGDSGGKAAFQFCPDCGSTVFWSLDALPDHVGVAVGAFADPAFFAPTFSVYEARRHRWTKTPDEGIEHYD